MLQANNTAEEAAANKTKSVLRRKEWEWLTNVIILSIFGSVAFLVFVFLIFYCIRKALRKRKERLRTKKKKKYISKKRKIRVKRMINCLQIWQFANVDMKYHEDKWVICLEFYEHYSELWITNECNHSFHKKWLYEWYLNTDPTQPFRCPHWNTINRRLLNSLSSSAQSIESSFDQTNILRSRTRFHSPSGPHVKIGDASPGIPAENLASSEDVF